MFFYQRPESIQFFSQSWKPTTAKPKPTKPSKPKPTRTPRPKPTRTTKRPVKPPVKPPAGSGGLKAGAPCEVIGKTFPHKNCQKYYRCVNKKLLVQKCTVGLAWNNKSGRCDWANLITCGKRTGGKL